MPRIRSVPEDFKVEERPLYTFDGSGGHVYLLIEKRLCTTDEVARSLARALGVPRRDVGYAGRKDRVALTRQWFSVPQHVAAGLETWRRDGARIVARDRHGEKLRVGQLAANRFRLVVREVEEAVGREAQACLGRLIEHGMPNRFGRQRFGRDGRNVERGAHILRSKRLRGNRQTAWLMISALQSAVFNRVLELRPASLDVLEQGEVAIVHATGEVFLVTEPVDPGRLERFEISPTGPIFGTKMLSPRGEAAQLEHRAMADFGVGDPRRLVPPRGLKLFGDRRPLRVQPKHTAAAWRDGVLELAFELPAGSYATVLLEELFAGGFDEGPPPADGPHKVSADRAAGLPP